MTSSLIPRLLYLKITRKKKTRSRKTIPYQRWRERKKDKINVPGAKRAKCILQKPEGTVGKYYNEAKDGSVN